MGYRFHDKFDNELVDCDIREGGVEEDQCNTSMYNIYTRSFYFMKHCKF